MNRFRLICLHGSLFVACWLGAMVAASYAQDIRVPASVVAGEAATISTTGNGKASFCLFGPGVSRKTEVTLGEEISIPAEDLRVAGEYLALVCTGTCRSGAFYVSAAQPASLTFLVHPSRVPVAASDAVSGVVLAFDHFGNLVLTPGTINVQLSAGDAVLSSRSIRTQNGAAWFRAASGKSAGALQVTASMDELSTRRAVQEVASDPCNLRIKGERTRAGIAVETEPVHDCAGNAVPDGTIVTFTASGPGGKSTVDAPIKLGIARARIEAAGAEVISAASGVVIGNELRIGAQP
jgi:hypothetical protein